MSRIPLTLREANKLIQSLVGLPISLPWKGYGSTIFLEIGNLASLKRSRNHQDGEACISIDWDWRVECDSMVKYGSSNSGPSIK